MEADETDGRREVVRARAAVYPVAETDGDWTLVGVGRTDLTSLSGCYATSSTCSGGPPEPAPVTPTTNARHLCHLL